MRMPSPRLVTYARLSAHTGSTYEVQLRHVARLDGGREIVLLEDHGLCGTTLTSSIVGRREEVEHDARVCVGPDEPVGDQTRAQAVTAHREHIARLLSEAGVDIDADGVGHLPHEVVLDEALARAVA
jgi:hypothetical protein